MTRDNAIELMKMSSSILEWNEHRNAVMMELGIKRICPEKRIMMIDTAHEDFKWFTLNIDRCINQLCGKLDPLSDEQKRSMVIDSMKRRLGL